MTSISKARWAFGSAVLLLLLSAVAAFDTFSNLVKSERLVAHSHEVQGVISDIESAAGWASRARLAYVFSGNEQFLPEYQAKAESLIEKVEHLKKLTRDNAQQQAHSARLEELIRERMRMWEESIRRRKAGPLSPADQADMTRQSTALTAQMAEITGLMMDEEDQLLSQRQDKANRLLRIVIAVFLGTFAAALLLFFIHYRLLKDELERRQRAEQAAMEAEHITRQGQEALRKLSLRLLRMQDEERRKFSRELHDSLGQYLVSLKMNLSRLHPGDGEGTLLAESLALLDESLAETRTMSYLLHPPLLDEAGFASAAEWYVNGFAQRSGIEVKVDIPSERLHLSSQAELVLFRILQESLTNIHKHAESVSASVSLSLDAGQVALAIKDAGKGIPQEVLSRFWSEGNAGVGLAGMRERVRELGGQLRIDSSSQGTTVTVTVPLPQAAASPPLEATTVNQKQRGSAA